MKAIFIIFIFLGCSEKQPEHSLNVTDSVIYYDSMVLINESP
jgi:hypothetical protein